MKYFVLIVIFPLRIICFVLSSFIHAMIELLNQEDLEWLVKVLEKI